MGLKGLLSSASDLGCKGSKFWVFKVSGNSGFGSWAFREIEICFVNDCSLSYKDSQEVSLDKGVKIPFLVSEWRVFPCFHRQSLIRRTLHIPCSVAGRPLAYKPHPLHRRRDSSKDPHTSCPGILEEWGFMNPDYRSETRQVP